MIRPNQELLRAFLAFTIAAASLLFPLATAARAADTGEYWPGSHSTPAFGDGSIRRSYCDVKDYMEGDLGALLTVCAGVVAIACAAFGNMRNAAIALMAAVGSATISAGVGLSFGDLCGGSSSGRTLSSMPAVEQAEVSRFSPADIAGFMGRSSEQAATEAEDDDSGESQADPF